MPRSVLFADDDEIIRGEFVATLKNADWDVLGVDGAEQALQVLSERKFDLLLLDLQLGPGRMQGLDLLEHARRNDMQLPPVVVVSSKLDGEVWKRVEAYGVRGTLRKPVPLQKLADLLDALCEGDQKRLLTFQDSPAKLSRETLLSEAVKKREAALLAYVRRRATEDADSSEQEPLLVVGRRWNSWYPSYFDVNGGAYVVRAVGTLKGGPTPGVLVDPGFRAVETLRTIGISVASLGSAVITHNHPDHLAGVFEYITIRHVLQLRTTLYCTRGVVGIFDAYRSFGVDVREFDTTDVDLVAAYEAVDQQLRRIRARPIPTAHQNVGPVDATRGILIVSEVGEAEGRFAVGGTALILGDTEYRSDTRGGGSGLFETIRKQFGDDDLRVAALHIGSAQFKTGTAKHLYLGGLLDLLHDVDAERRQRVRRAREDKLLVLISEWGLEHASRPQLHRALRSAPSDELAQEFSDDNLVIETAQLLRDMRFDTLRILPADVGLSVGIHSGHVYLKGKPPVPPERVICTFGDEGLAFI